jgi:hypothetical protein
LMVNRNSNHVCNIIIIKCFFNNTVCQLYILTRFECLLDLSLWFLRIKV